MALQFLADPDPDLGKAPIEALRAGEGQAVIQAAHASAHGPGVRAIALDAAQTPCDAPSMAGTGIVNLPSVKQNGVADDLGREAVARVVGGLGRHLVSVARPLRSSYGPST
jgi:hypothetical protein